jgi:thymidylate synthase
MCNNIEDQYLSMLSYVLTDGFVKQNRTGVPCITVPPLSLTHDMSRGFPIMTTKKMGIKSIATELQFFIGGMTDKNWLKERKCNIWNEWCNPTRIPAELSGEERLKFMAQENDLGPIYGYQWRRFNRDYTIPVSNPFPTLNPGRELIHGDQLAYVVNTLKSNPNDRRMHVNAWNPQAIPQQALPPCFPEGVHVKIKDGQYIDIKDIRIGDYVLTEDGSYRMVYDTSCVKFNGKFVNIKIHGFTNGLKSTFNHPHLVKDKGYIEAENIKPGDYVGIPRDRNFVIPSFQISKATSGSNYYSNEYICLGLQSYWYFLGYFLGNGWVQKHDKILISIPHNKEQEILSMFPCDIPLCRLSNSGDNCSKWEVRRQLWSEILIQFGNGALLKHIPDFVFNGNATLINSFLDGYYAADGCDGKLGRSATTVSKHIAYGIQLLSIKVGRFVSVIHQVRPTTCVIEGRLVNQNNTYSLNEAGIIYESDNYIFERNICWVKVVDVETTDDTQDVYNLSVATNHTYTVNNIITHNCHLSFTVQHIDGKLHLNWVQRSCDSFLGVPYNIASYALLLELLAKESGMVAGTLTGSLVDVHIYENHVDQVKEQISRAPHALPKLVFNKWSNIWNWDASDVALEGYTCYDAIKAPIVV